MASRPRGIRRPATSSRRLAPVYQLSGMATDAGKDMIERNASKWHAMQKELLAPKAFGGDIKADNDGKKLTLTFEMRIPSVIMLEITALDDDDGDDDD